VLLDEPDDLVMLEATKGPLEFRDDRVDLPKAKGK
jgi:hypothetical protein